MKKVREETQSALSKAVDEMKRFADQNRSEAPIYNVGDKVYLDNSNMATNQPSKKLAHKRFSPYKITKKISDRAYELKLLRSMKPSENWI